MADLLLLFLPVAVGPGADTDKAGNEDGQSEEGGDCEVVHTYLSFARAQAPREPELGLL